MRRRTPGSGDAQLISSDVSRDRPPTPQPNTRPKGWELRRMQSEQDATQGAALVHQMIAHLGGIEDLSRTAAEGDVLLEGSYVVPANGVFAREFPAGFSAVMVANQYGCGELVVASQPPQSQAPTQGVGNFRVPSCVVRTAAAKGTVVSVYGNPGGTFDLVVFSRPRPPMVALCRRGPVDGVLVLAGQTASTTSFLSGNLERAVVVANVSAVAGGSVTVQVNGLTPSGYSFPYFTAPGMVLSALGAGRLIIGPGLTPATDAVANDVVARQLQIVATVAGSIAYGIDFIGG